VLYQSIKQAIYLVINIKPYRDLPDAHVLFQHNFKIIFFVLFRLQDGVPTQRSTKYAGNRFSLKRFQLPSDTQPQTGVKWST